MSCFLKKSGGKLYEVNVGVVDNCGNIGKTKSSVSRVSSFNT